MTRTLADFVAESMEAQARKRPALRLPSLSPPPLHLQNMPPRATPFAWIGELFSLVFWPIACWLILVILAFSLVSLGDAALTSRDWAPGRCRSPRGDTDRSAGGAS